MSKILQIATGHQALMAEFRGQPSLPILMWALCDDGGKTHLAGMVLNPETKAIERADELDGFKGYSGLAAPEVAFRPDYALDHSA